MSPLKVLAASLAGLLLLPVLVISAVAGGLGSAHRSDDQVATAASGDVIELAGAVLSNPNIELMPNARTDVAAHRVDPRVLQVLVILAGSHRLAPVGPMITGHSYFVAGTTRVSNHVSGRAVDILGVDGAAVTSSNAGARRVIEEALSLPAPLTPHEIGGPWIVRIRSRASFTDADHQDHIHIGYDR